MSASFTFSRSTCTSSAPKTIHAASHHRIAATTLPHTTRGYVAIIALYAHLRAIQSPANSRQSKHTLGWPSRPATPHNHH